MTVTNSSEQGGVLMDAMVRDYLDVTAKPYMVWHEEGEGAPPTFATWAEALAKQKEWNRTCPGHRAYRREMRAKGKELARVKALLTTRPTHARAERIL